MALKPTIYKFRISLSDLNTNHYDSLSLTVAQHPSENNQRMLARVLAYCLNSQHSLKFTKGLSTTEQPDMWSHSLDDIILLWIDVGEPDVDRIKKASRKAEQVKVFSFNTKSDLWWEQNQRQIADFANVEVHQFEPGAIEEVAQSLVRGMEMSVMISDESIFIDTDAGSYNLVWKKLQCYE
ncbi:YaeQ family protein [Vibrio marisflavi]|uniref:YaeQ protein n=1 Tax=Vibrio marisflavi CECT 7928 TaxID=634439 RepID=A0ABN8DXR0_9VIBR|nr:YaeQ family protein [Vibrio marisflavi]CAH0536353.1 putative protein YaeQ [Vibrio marisflavi CECT 7928]